jgi:hypothetical protein
VHLPVRTPYLGTAISRIAGARDKWMRNQQFGRPILRTYRSTMRSLPGDPRKVACSFWLSTVDRGRASRAQVPKPTHVLRTPVLPLICRDRISHLSSFCCLHLFAWERKYSCISTKLDKKTRKDFFSSTHVCMAEAIGAESVTLRLSLRIGKNICCGLLRIRRWLSRTHVANLCKGTDSTSRQQDNTRSKGRVRGGVGVDDDHRS